MSMLMGFFVLFMGRKDLKSYLQLCTTALEELLHFEICDILHFLCCQRLIPEHRFTEIWYLQQSASLYGSGVKTNLAE